MTQTVYVSIVHRGLYMHPHDSTWEFALQLRRDGYRAFQRLFQQMNMLEGPNMWRAQTPYLQYHLDKENDELDVRLMKLYALVHEFGDADIKKFVEQLPFFRV